MGIHWWSIEVGSAGKELEIYLTIKGSWEAILPVTDSKKLTLMKGGASHNNMSQ